MQLIQLRKVIFVLLAVAFLPNTTSAGAQEIHDGTAKDGTSIINQYNAADVKAAWARLRNRADEFAAQRARLRGQVDDFVEQRARMGGLVDVQAVEAVELDRTTVVWEKGVEIDGLLVAEGTDARGNLTGAATIGVKSYATEEMGLEGGVNGMGMDLIPSVRGGVSLGTSCQTTRHKAAAGDTDHKMISCWQKIKTNEAGLSAGLRRNNDYYVYNRWGFWDAAEGGGIGTRYGTRDATIRSRPWRGKEKQTKALQGWHPLVGNPVCNEGGSLNFGYAGLSATVPIQSCDYSEVYPDTSKRSMGVMKLATFALPNQVDADFLMYIQSPAGVQPVMADYIWGEFCFTPSLISSVDCPATDKELWKDDGW